MLPHNDADTVFITLCRERNWRRTAQRRAVFSYLYGNKEHPSVEMIWQHVKRMVPDVSLDSIYRILREFTVAGVVKTLESGDMRRYDPNIVEHDHFLCTRCGRMHDFHFLDSEQARRECGRFGRVESIELQVRGVCRDCMSREARDNS